MKEQVEILTRSGKETKKLGEILAQEVLKFAFAKASADKLKTATVLSLEGELGSGKTTFTQGFAKGLGIKENPRSPTFVIMQIYGVNKLNRSAEFVKFKNFIHVDAYRLKSKDFKILNWRDFMRNPQNIILIEWGNRVKIIMPRGALILRFRHGHLPHERTLRISNSEIFNFQSIFKNLKIRNSLEIRN
ncbi:MAG: tRNA (adenosine(37)-N6)-threonylcarbamoyltransferase complex ATPase subunit type 1 TsaE [Candidatus Giovannonibacteria bacterium]|nr:MAG: tRNA (adenosine(37)-N6)-threonylcarbamoyltransferase complex ATPase subunit type 1 TsaE [Candidatus Giovannonibacteria bacterium]